MFVVRQVGPKDSDALLELAHHLGQSGSLRTDPVRLQEQIELSLQSFSNKPPPKEKAVYLFVLEDFFSKKIVGASLIFAKHGTPDSPHTYLRVLKKVHKDKSTGIRMEHRLLRFEFDSDGPTEIGGLILHPDYRGLPIGLGKQLSYTRFVYMGLHPDRFEKQVIAELLPPFNEDGTSELWEAFGKRFTGLSYSEADQLSRVNKDFIKALFPSEDIYTNLFSAKAQSVIGRTGPTSNAAKLLLERIGFKYLDAVDPFDGGPHYGAKLKEITLIKRLKKVRLSSEPLDSLGNRGLLAFENAKGFFSLSAPHRLEDEVVYLDREVREILEKCEADPQELYLVSPI